MGTFFRCIVFCFFCRVRHYSTQSTGDSSSDSNGDDDAIDSMLPGSAIRAKKSAAAKEQAKAQVQEERCVSVLLLCQETVG